MKYLILSDAHGDWQAIETAIKAGKAAGGFDKIWYLGDAIGRANGLKKDDYDPKKCVLLLRQLEATCVIGNWEGWLRHPTWDDDPRRPQRDHQEELSSLRELLAGDALQTVIAWPEQVERETEEDSFTLTHGCPYSPVSEREPWETYIWGRDTDLVQDIFDLKHISTKHLIVGHTHIPGFFHYNGDVPSWTPLEDGKEEIEIKMDKYQGRYVLEPGSISDPRSPSFGSPSAILLDGALRTFRFLRLISNRVNKIGERSI